MDEASVQRGLQKALSESSTKGVKTKHETELAPTDSDASSRSGSPDQCCPICLGKFKDKSFSDGCFHRFCFQCIREWAKVKSTCPLCKTPFKSIIHNVVSSDVYDQYVLQPTENGSLELDRNGARFRYHTTLTTNRRSAWETRMDQLFNRQARLAERIHRENEARQRRQLIYAASLRVHHIAANRFTRFRDTSPHFFRENPAITHRLIPWLRRDLGVLFNGNDQHVRFMTQYILSLLPNVDIQSEEFHNHLRPFLYGRTEHFIHEFTSFARSPHDMDTYDQMAQYDFRPENPQFTATLRPQHQRFEQEHSTSEESENNHSNNNDVIVISDDESDGDPVILPAESSQSSSHRQEHPGLSSATDRAGPSTSYDLSSTHNPEPPAGRHPDQPGPSGMASSGSLQIKQEQDTAHARKESEASADSSSSIEIVGYQKPFHLRTPIAFITISDESSDGRPATESKGKLSRNKERLAPRRSLGEEKAGGKRKQKTKHTRSLHSSNRAGNWSTDSDDSYYSKSRHDGYYRRSRDAADDRDGPCTSRYRSQSKSSSNRRPSRSPNELFRKVREEEGKWSLYYETKHDNCSRNGRSRSPSRSKSTSSRRYGDDYNDYSRSRDYYRDLPRPLRDERSQYRSRSGSRERSRNRSRHYEDDYRRSRSKSRGRSVDFFSDDSKFSSRYGSRYGSTSSTFSKHSHHDSYAHQSSKKDISSSSHVSTSKASRSPELKRTREDDNEDRNKVGESHASKKHKHKHRHHKKKSSRHKHKSKSRDRESKSRKKDKHGKHHSSSHDKNLDLDREKAIIESISDSTVDDGEKDRPNKAAPHSNIETARAEPRNITLQDLLNMDESMTFDPTLPAVHPDRGSGSSL